MSDKIEIERKYRQAINGLYGMSEGSVTMLNNRIVLRWSHSRWIVSQNSSLFLSDISVGIDDAAELLVGQ